MLVIISAVFLVVASGVQAQNCCGPKAYKAVHNELFSPNFTEYHDVLSLIAVDHNQQMVAANQSLYNGRERLHQRVLVNFKSKTLYVVEERFRECKIFPLRESMPPNCIPSTFHQLYSFYFGGSTDKLAMKSFFGPIGRGGEATVTVTKNLCLPVSQVDYFHRSHRVVQSFVNFTIGAISPSEFNVPPECRRVQQVETTKLPVHVQNIVPYHQLN